MQITINVPDGYQLVASVQGTNIPADPSAINNAWLVALLEYGFQRRVNDRANSLGKDGTVETKVELAREIVATITDPESSPRAARGRAPGLSPLDTEAANIVLSRDVNGVFKGTAKEKRIAALAWLETQADAVREDVSKRAQAVLNAREAANTLDIQIAI